MLEGVGEGVVGGISSLPKPVSLGEFLWRKGCESQQVVRAVFDQIDSKIISGVDAEVRTVLVAKRETFQFQKAVQGGVLHSLDLRDIHQAPDGLALVDLTIWGKHGSQLEGEHVWTAAHDLPINLRYFLR